MTNDTLHSPSRDGAENAGRTDAAALPIPAEPKQTAGSPDQPISEAAARAILRERSTPADRHERDPLLEDPAGSDPLLEDAGRAENDPLGGPEEEPEIPSEIADPAEAIPVPSETPAAPEGSPSEPENDGKTDSTPADAPEGAVKNADPEGGKRLDLYRKNARGEFVYNARERAAMQFAEESGIGVIEAWSQLFGETPPAGAADGKASADSQTPEGNEPPQPTPAELQQQIQALREQRKDAAKSLDTAKANDLTDQIEDLLDRKSAATQQEMERGRALQTAARHHATAQIESMHRAGALFPEAVADGSALHGALTLEIAKIERANPAFFRDPEWPESLTAKLAARMGLTPASRKPTSSAAAAAVPAAEPGTAAKPVPPRLAARPAPAPGGISGAARPQTTQDFQARLGAARARNDLPAIKALMREARSLTRP